MLSSWNQSLTISCVSYVSAAASDYQRVRRILQTYAYTYMFRGRILRTPRIRTCVDRGLVSAYFCCMRILHCTCIWDTAYSFFAVYVSVCGYKLYPCVTRDPTTWYRVGYKVLSIAYRIQTKIYHGTWLNAIYCCR